MKRACLQSEEQVGWSKRSISGTDKSWNALAWFTEGFDTVDLKEALALIEGLDH